MIRYLLGAICSIPLLPIMAIQGKQIRKKVPTLPPATGPEGSATGGAERLRLLALGESTIACLGAETHEEGLTGSLAKELARHTGKTVDWTVVARAGYTAQLVKERLVPRMKGKRADLIAIGLGGNDAFTLNRPWRWNRQVRELIAEIRKEFPETPLLFLNVPPIKEFPAFTPLIQFVVGNLVNILGEELNKIARDTEGVYYSSEEITLQGWMKKYDQEGPKSGFFSDGVHPALITYQTWAKDAAQFVMKEKILEESDRANLLLEIEDSAFRFSVLTKNTKEEHEGHKGI